MSYLEPTYLRYVYDGLLRETFQADNAAGLPDGLVGAYDQAFNAAVPVAERQGMMRELAVWALLKKEASTVFVARVLGVEAEHIADQIARFSSWFNSPEPGKYQLYHERLKVYLLQKLSEQELYELQEKLITFLEQAMAEQKADEVELYALEHLHIHLAVASQLGKHYERLHNYVNRESLWRRQIQLSKGYEWSQKAVQQGIKEGARRQHELNTIRSTVNSVKLMTREQNSAEDILNLLNEGDYHTALKRAENWEGERQFKLYLLMLHDLTIGESKQADFRKEACKAVLEAIDQTPEDHTVLDWAKFYPEMAIYRYFEQLIKMKLDGMMLWARGNYSMLDILSTGEIDLDLVEKILMEMRVNKKQSRALSKMSDVHLSNDNIEKSVYIARHIKNNIIKTGTFVEIAKNCFLRGDRDTGISLLEKCVEFAKGIEDGGLNHPQSEIWVSISSIARNYISINYSIEIADKITSNQYKVLAYCETVNFIKRSSGDPRLEKYESKLENLVFQLDDELEYMAHLRFLRFKAHDYSLQKIDSTILRFKRIYQKAHESLRPFILFELYIAACEIHYLRNNLRSADEWLNKSIIEAKEIHISGDRYMAFLQVAKIQMMFNRKSECLKYCSLVDDEDIRSHGVIELYKQGVESDLCWREEVLNLINNLESCCTVIMHLEVYFKNGSANEIDRIKELLRRFFDNSNSVADKVDVYLNLLESASLHDFANNLIDYQEQFSKIETWWITATQERKLLDFFFKKNFTRDVKEYVFKFLSYPIKLANIDSGKSFCRSIINILESGYWFRDENYILELAHIVEIRSNNFEVDVDLIMFLLTAGEKSSALNILNDIEDSFDFVQTRIICANLLLRQKKSELATEIIEGATVRQEELSSIGGVKFEVDIAEIYARIGQHDIANSILQQATEFALKLDDSKDISAVDILLSVCNVHDLMGQKMIIIEILKDLMIRAEQIHLPEPEFECLIKIAALTHSIGMREPSIAIIQGWLDKLESLEDIHSRISSGLSLSQTLFLVDFEKFQEVLNQCVQLINEDQIEIDDEEDFFLEFDETTYAVEESCFEMVKFLCNHGNYIQALDFVLLVEPVSLRQETLQGMGKSMSYTKIRELIPFIHSEGDRRSLMSGHAQAVNEGIITNTKINPYLYNHSEFTENLANILFYQAKMACFFEKERNEEKLDMLSEVLDIKEWRKLTE